MDPWTQDTLAMMVRYVKCDRRIARYLGIDEDQVRAARGYVPRPRQKAVGSFDQRDFAGAKDAAMARVAAKRGSDRLLKAILREGL